MLNSMAIKKHKKKHKKKRISKKLSINNLFMNKRIMKNNIGKEKRSIGGSKGGKFFQ